MSASLTIRNLGESVMQKLRVLAANHQRSMETETREILTRAVSQPVPATQEATAPVSDATALAAITQLRGQWQGRGSTAELMHHLRGGD